MFRRRVHILLIAVIVVVFVIPSNHRIVNADAAYCLQFEQTGTMLANPRTGAVTVWPSDQQRHAYFPPNTAPGFTNADFMAADGKHYYEIATAYGGNGTNASQALLVEDTANHAVTVLKRAAAIIGAGWAKWGNRIAYVWREQATDTTVSIRIIRADGRIDYGSTVLPSAFATTSNTSVDVDWSSDGMYLAITNSDHIYLLATDTLQFDPTNYVSIYNTLQWSSTGHRFAVYTGDHWLIGAPGQVNELMISGGTTAWSPNNRYIAIAHEQLEPGSDIIFHITIFDTADNTSWEVRGKDITDLGEGIIIDQQMYWSGDSRYLVYTSHPASEALLNLDLMVTDTETRQEIMLVKNLIPSDLEVQSVVSAPNGNRFAAWSQDRKNGTVSVSLLNPDGTGKTEFVHKATLIERLSWSPDGNLVAYVAATTPPANAIMDNLPSPTPEVVTHNAPFQLVYAKADGSARHILTYPQARILFWQAGSLVFIAGTPTGNYTVRRLDPLTGKLTVLADGISYAQYVNTAVGAWGYWNIYPSPTGSTVLLTTIINFAGTVGRRVSPSGVIAALNLADKISGVAAYLARWQGSQYLTLFNSIPYSEDIRSVRWSPDGSMVAISIANQTYLDIYAADGRLILHLSDEIYDMVWLPCP